MGVCIVHAFVVEPAAEKVPAAQSTTTASAVVEHCVVMRLPAEVPVHVPGHASVVEPAAEKVPSSHSSMVASVVEVQPSMTRWPGPGVEQAMHSEDPASSAYVPVAQTVQPAASLVPPSVTVPA